MPSKIEWTDETWSPVTGCTKVSTGCKNCYAERQHARLGNMGVEKYAEPFSVVRWHESELARPTKWRKPRMVFTCSMADLFHENVPVLFQLKVFNVMKKCPRHTFQVLTKRPERMRIFVRDFFTHGGCDVPSNIWLGTSIENEKAHYDRFPSLYATPCAVRFLSVEPLLGPIDFGSLEGIHWLICGGESGPGARPMKPEWVRAIRDQCVAQNVPFFFKQWGGVDKTKTGRELDGRTWDEMPAVKEPGMLF